LIPRGTLVPLLERIDGSHGRSAIREVGPFRLFQMKERLAVPRTSSRNWNDSLPLLALVPVEIVFYGGYVIVFGMYALPFCLFLAGVHVAYIFGDQGYCVWKASSYVPKWLGRLFLLFWAGLWCVPGVLIGNRDLFLLIFNR
jgi:hypothetical protein